MQYLSEFPHDARARVEAETRRAYIALEQDVRGMESWRRNVPFLRCVMRIFLAFAREACEFGKKSHHPGWSDCELDQRCRDFLLEIVVDAWEHKANALGVRKVFSSHGWGYSINDEDRRKIEKSSEWKQYQELLIEAFDAQSAPAAHNRLPQPEAAAQMAAESENAVAAPRSTVSSAECGSSILSDGQAPVRRSPKDFIDAAKCRRTRSYEKFAALIGISKDTLYAITKESRWVSDANYKLVADFCECNSEDLHPRDVPRPERR